MSERGTSEAIAERDRRYRRLRDAMAADEIAGLLAYAPAWRRENVRYLTAAEVRGGLALAYLPAEGEPTAFVASTGDEARVQRAGFVSDVRRLSSAGMLELADRMRADAAVGPIGVAHAELMPDAIDGALRRGLPQARFVSATGLMDRVRLVKSDWELARLRRCGALCDAGWQTLVAMVRPGVAEYEIVAEVEAALKAAGAEDNFLLIASGGNEVRGMTPPSRRRLALGDMVRSELSPQLDGYWTQLCRTVVVGAATDRQRASFELFEEAVRAGLDALRPGVTAHDVARAENDVFRRRGLGGYCTAEHTRVRGHGHGLHLDEVAIVEGNATVLEEGAVLIVHPNTFTPIAGYHVLGDPVVVTHDGPQPLLRTARALDERPV